MAQAGIIRKDKRKRQSLYYLAIFFTLFWAPLFAIHFSLLNLPFFWDEHGQFIPTALDLLRSGSWIAHSTVPNVHPPGVEAYLVLWYKLFGFSILITRVAMLLLAGVGLLATFLLAIELSKGAPGAPAFLPPFLFIASPLFYTQSIMAQLDMPAMVFTVLALLFFVRTQYAAAAIVSCLLALTKETGIVVPFVFFLVLVGRKQWRQAAFFVFPAIVLFGWLFALHRATGFWLGNPGFAHYNVSYSLNPVRMALSFARRIYYLFFAEFRWIGTLAILYVALKFRPFTTPAWRVAIAASAATLGLVSVLGGAELERYLLPILPIFFIAVSVAFAHLRRWIAALATIVLLVGLVVNLFWNPPYPFPFENNYAMVDFVHLQEIAARYLERNLGDRIIATAWPYSAALQTPEYGFVSRKMNVVEMNNFHTSSIRALPPDTFDALVTYTRTWAPKNGVVAIPFVRQFLARFYDWQPQITSAECADLGLQEVASWTLRGQEIVVYVRKREGSRYRPAHILLRSKTRLDTSPSPPT